MLCLLTNRLYLIWVYIIYVGLTDYPDILGLIVFHILNLNIKLVSIGVTSVNSLLMFTYYGL